MACHHEGAKNVVFLVGTRGLLADRIRRTLRGMYKHLAASAARFHWGSKVGVGVAGTSTLDDTDRDVFERRKTHRRFDLADSIHAAGLDLEATHSWRVECLAGARSELGRIPENQYKAVLTGLLKLWRSPKKKTQQNKFNEQLRRFKTSGYRVGFCIEPPSSVIVFRVIAEKRPEGSQERESRRTRDIRLSAGWNLLGPPNPIKPKT